MMTSSLSGFPACNEALDPEVPTETYLFHQILPISQTIERKTRQAAIPMEVANPAFLQSVQEHFGASAPTILSRLRKPILSLDPAWNDVTVPPPPSVAEVAIPDVSAILVAGKITHDGVDYDISRLGDVTASLTAREPVVTTLTSGASTVRLRLVPLATSRCELPDRITIDSGMVPKLAGGDLLILPGVGGVDLGLTSDGAKKLLQDGFTTLSANVGGETRELLIETPRLMLTRGPLPAGGGPVVGSTPSGTPPPPVSTGTGGMTPAQYHWLEPGLAVYVPIRQVWKSNGYVRGSLINTFSLAPQEQITVELFSWDRRKTESEVTSSRESQASSEQSFSTKASQEVVDKASQENGWKFGAQAGFQVPQIALKVGADFSISQTNQTSLTNTLQNVSEAVAKSANSIKSSFQTKVTEAREYGSEERITRKFQNPNFGRVLHFDCFEVLHDWSVTTRYDFANAKLCALLPMVDLLQGIEGRDTHGLASLLLGMEGMLYDFVPARLQGGFDAARLILAWDRICQYACDSACDCSPPEGTTGNTGAASAGNPYEADLNAAMQSLRDAIGKVRGATGNPLKQVVGIPATEPGYLARSPEDQLARRLNWHAYLFRRVVLEQGLSGFWSACIAFDQGDDNDGLRLLQQIVDQLVPSVSNMLNPGFAYGSVGTLVITQLLQSVTDFGANLPFMMAYLGFHDYGLQTIATRTLTLYGQWKKVEDDKKKPVETGDDAAAQAADDSEKRRSEAEAFSAEALATASVAIDALAGYLRQNKSGFQALIWSMLSPDDRRRYVALAADSAGYIGTTLLGYIDGLIAITFDESAMPATIREWFTSQLLGYVVPPTDVKSLRLPVPGMTMQTRVEGCDALEPYLVESRGIELSRLRALSAQQDVEVKRREARLTKGDLSDPSPAMPPLKVETITSQPT